MNGPNENAVIFFDTEILQATAKFASTFIAVGDASNAPWGFHVFGKHSGKLNGKRFRFPAAWTRQHNTVPDRFEGGRLARIISKFLRCLHVRCAHFSRENLL